MRELAVHSESQFMWLRCHAYCGPMRLVDFSQSSEEYLRAYCPPSLGRFKNVVGALRHGVFLLKEMQTRIRERQAEQAAPLDAHKDARQ
jgi:hypothetical protein